MKVYFQKLAFLFLALLSVFGFQNCAKPSLEAGDNNQSQTTTTGGCPYGTDPLSGNCMNRICRPSEVISQVSCISQVQNAATATRTLMCDSFGTSTLFGTCIISSCSPGYVLDSNSNTCLPDPGP